MHSAIPKEDVERLLTYYRGFHHTCITWYITVMGFFVAGLIAAGTPLSLTVCTAILVVGSILGVAFFMCIFHYGARIAVLDDYLATQRIPNDWRVEHKKRGLRIKGVGSYFFLIILVVMQVAVWWLALSPRHM